MTPHWIALHRQDFVDVGVWNLDAVKTKEASADCEYDRDRNYANPPSRDFRFGKLVLQTISYQVMNLLKRF
jgi:hypothetical protein